MEELIWEKCKIPDYELEVEIEGYSRVSVDIELDRDNTSIENQETIITDFVAERFPKCRLTLTHDRDESGYSFIQRTNYGAMRERLMSKRSRILVVKDFSRFARRNSLGLYELELLRDEGVRIISINDNIDYPTNDEWLHIQLKFLMNEQPVTEASKKVKAVIAKRQSRGEWLCSVPYGYIITDYENNKYEIVPDEAEVVETVFSLYNKGFGYKKIADYLSDKHIPTPRMKERERAEAKGKKYKNKVRDRWSIVTISNILTNDFYIGTFRQHKYQRRKINGKDVPVSKDEQIVFERYHAPIIDERLFYAVQEALSQRATVGYRGVKKYDTPYSGYLFCGDCGSPMFSMSRPDLPLAYTCGEYHKRGLKGCTSHHIRVDFLNKVLKDYIKMVSLNSQEMISELSKAIDKEPDDIANTENLICSIERRLNDAKETLKAAKIQKIKEIAKSPETEDIIEETYREIEKDLTNKIYGLQTQLSDAIEKRSVIIKATRVAKTVVDEFEYILNKEKLEKQDIGRIVDRIEVFDDGNISISLKAEIMGVLERGELPNELLEESAVNFNLDSINNSFLNLYYNHKSVKQRAKVYTVNVINEGDPLLTTLTQKDRLYEMITYLSRIVRIE